MRHAARRASLVFLLGLLFPVSLSPAAGQSETPLEVDSVTGLAVYRATRASARHVRGFDVSEIDSFPLRDRTEITGILEDAALAGPSSSLLLELPSGFVAARYTDGTVRKHLLYDHLPDEFAYLRPAGTDVLYPLDSLARARIRATARTFRIPPLRKQVAAVSVLETDGDRLDSLPDEPTVSSVDDSASVARLVDAIGFGSPVEASELEDPFRLAVVLRYDDGSRDVYYLTDGLRYAHPGDGSSWYPVEEAGRRLLDRLHREGTEGQL